MWMTRYQITHILKREAQSVPLSQPHLPERWHLSGDFAHLPLGGEFIALGGENTRRECYQCWEPQGTKSLGEVFPCFSCWGKEKVYLSPLQLGMGWGEVGASRTSPVKIWGACKKGQMVFHFLEACSLLICPGHVFGE